MHRMDLQFNLHLLQINTVIKGMLMVKFTFLIQKRIIMKCMLGDEFGDFVNVKCKRYMMIAINIYLILNQIR